MSTEASTRRSTRDISVSIAGLRFAVFTTRNFVFLLAVLAMNYTIMRPSPVDFLYILSFLVTLIHIALSPKQTVTRSAVALSLLLGTWAVSYVLASLPHLAETNVIFELIAKTFAISIGLVAAFVTMSWNRRHFETFMKVYIVSCVIASILGTIGFVLQNDALTWDGRARGFIDDPNMYGSFLIPAVMFCVYFAYRPHGNKLIIAAALGVILLGIVLSFSRIAQVSTMVCFASYVIFQDRRRPRRLLMMAGGMVGALILLVAVVSFAPSEFSEKFMDRLTLAESYDVGETGRYTRYVLVLPMILQNPIGIGVLQLEKIFPEPIHNIWLSSFVNYGWVAGFAWIILVVSSVITSIRNYRRTKDDLAIVLLISLIGIVLCASLHEGEHWRHLWLAFGLVWGLCPLNFNPDAKPLAHQRPPAGGGLPPPRRVRMRARASQPAAGTGAPARAKRQPSEQLLGEAKGAHGKARRVPPREIAAAATSTSTAGATSGWSQD